jgi:O-ureido-D-serine cyclo-ligase
MLALVTAREARALDEDLPPLEKALDAAGIAYQLVDWDDATIDWSQFRLALIRSTWDYTDRLPEFLTWSERVSAATRLLNPAPVVRWNTHKRYLVELAAQGVAVVPTWVIEVGQPAPAFDASEVVVKPAVGAGSRGARRFQGDGAGAKAHAQALLDDGRDVLIQPYLGRVDTLGETSLLYFDGVYSHAIRKGPLLAANADATRALFAAERIAAREPGADERAVADAVLAALPFEPLLYARVDLLRGADGAPQLLELELTEPSLFFNFAPGSAERFVAAIARRL